jgi:hypothetical protein
LEPEQAGLSRLLDQHVRFGCERIRSGAANATPKLTAIVAGVATGADTIDGLDLSRAGGMKHLFDGVYLGLGGHSDICHVLTALMRTAKS